MNLPSTWILLADGAKAKVLRYNGPRKPLTQVDDGQLSHTHKPTRELASNKRGRVFHSADGTRSAMEHSSDPHEYEKRKFSREVSAFLENHSKEFERLLIVAAPEFLGLLRDDLPQGVRACVTDELSKDITHIPLKDVRSHLQEVINIDAKAGP